MTNDVLNYITIPNLSSLCLDEKPSHYLAFRWNVCIYIITTLLTNKVIYHRRNAMRLSKSLNRPKDCVRPLDGRTSLLCRTVNKANMQINKFIVSLVLILSKLLTICNFLLLVIWHMNWSYIFTFYIQGVSQRLAQLQGMIGDLNKSLFYETKVQINFQIDSIFFHFRVFDDHLVIFQAAEKLKLRFV